MGDSRWKRHELHVSAIRAQRLIVVELAAYVAGQSGADAKE